jgi:hypothetical protein
MINMIATGNKKVIEEESKKTIDEDTDAPAAPMPKPAEKAPVKKPKN